MLGMVKAQQGSIHLYGKADLKAEASCATRRLFSYVPQDNTLFSGTVAENLRLASPQATDDMLVNALKTACAYDFVSALPYGMETVVGESGEGLSKGQIQRISIARALLSDAPILLLDEATSALDAETEKALLENIMKHQQGRTCIVTTHRPSVLFICKQAYRIGDKGITLLENKEELLQKT